MRETGIRSTSRRPAPGGARSSHTTAKLLRPRARFDMHLERLSERFFQLRPALRGEAGRLGTQLVSEWLWEHTGRAPHAGRAPAPEAGELFWRLLLGRRRPPGIRVDTVVDAAAGFVGFLGAAHVLHPGDGERLRRDVRTEGLAYLAMTMGLLSDREVAERVRRYGG